MSDIDALLKIGGSITKLPDDLKRLCGAIENLNGKGYDLIVLAGGGKPADAVRLLYDRYRISEDAAHWMAIQAMNINSFLLEDISTTFKKAKNPKECKKVVDDGLIPVFFPYSYLKQKDPVPRSWKVTSDSISLYLASELNPQSHVLLKDVDGIYKDPENQQELLEEVTASTLNSMSETCIDSYFPELTKKYGRETYVISGMHPERLKKTLKGKETRGTIIKP